ncbi:MAG: hypothetical protein HYY17_00370 [Planctomycetes bacterium]|nr:hypothetical protein [Planctomycetota bacterium]
MAAHRIVPLFLALPLFAQDSGRDLRVSDGRSAPAGDCAAVLAGLRVGAPVRYGRLTLFPVYRDAKELPVVPLDAALKARWVRLKEVGTGSRARLEGAAPEHYVYIDNGLVLDGGGQDSTTGGGRTQPPRGKGNNGVGNGEDPQPPGDPPENDGEGTGPGDPGNRRGPRPIWVGDFGTFCCEKGRSGGPDTFAAAEHLAPPRIRQLTTRGGAQQRIWDSVEEMEKAVGAGTGTHSLDALYRQRRVKDPAEAAVAALAPARRNATGVVYAIDDRIVGADLYAGPNHFRLSFAMVVKSYALEALATAPPAKKVSLPSQSDARGFLAAALAGDWTDTGARDAASVFCADLDSLHGTFTLAGRSLVRAELFAKPAKEKKTPTKGGK